MAVALVGSHGALATNAGASVTLAFGTGQNAGTAGHLLEAWVYALGANTITAPSGWTKVTGSDAVGAYGRVARFYKWAVGGTPETDLAWSSSSATYMAGSLTELSGVDPTNPVGTSGVSTSIDANGTTTTTDGSVDRTDGYAMHAVGIHHTSAQTATHTPGGSWVNQRWQNASNANHPGSDVLSNPGTGSTLSHAFTDSRSTVDGAEGMLVVYQRDLSQTISLGAAACPVAAAALTKVGGATPATYKAFQVTRQVSNNQLVGNATSLTLADGDLLVAFCFKQDDASSYGTPPSGWTRIGSDTAGANGELGGFWKIWSTGDPNTWNFDQPGGTTITGGFVLMIQFSGADDTAAIDSGTWTFIGYMTGVPQTASAASSSGGARRAVAGFCKVNTESTTWAPVTAGWAEQGDGTGAEVSTKTMDGAGTTGSYQATPTGDGDGHGYCFVIAPAGPPPPQTKTLGAASVPVAATALNVIGNVTKNLGAAAVPVGAQALSILQLGNVKTVVASGVLGWVKGATGSGAQGGHLFYAKNRQRWVFITYGTHLDSGTATGAGQSTSQLVDTSKNWGAGAFYGASVIFTGGTGAGQIVEIGNNTSTTLPFRNNGSARALDAADVQNPKGVAPVAGSTTYVIVETRKARVYVSSSADLATATWSEATGSPSGVTNNNTGVDLSAGRWDGGLGADADYPGDGRHLVAAYADISGVDVFMVAVLVNQHWNKNWIRFRLTGTSTVTWDNPGTGNAWADSMDHNEASPYALEGMGLGISSTNRWHFLRDENQNATEPFVSWAGAADTGAADLYPTYSGFWAYPGDSLDSGITGGAYVHQAAMIPLASGYMLAVYTDPTFDSGIGEGKAKNVGLHYAVSSSATAWSQNTGAQVPNLSNASNPSNDWGICRRTDTDIHLVRRNSATVLEHVRFSGQGGSWGSKVNLPTSGLTGHEAGTGVALVSDGTDVWCFVVDSDASHTVRYCKWSSASGFWDSAWTAVPTNVSAKTFLAAHYSPAQIGITWTVGTGPYAVELIPLSLGAVPQTITLGAAGVPVAARALTSAVGAITQVLGAGAIGSIAAQALSISNALVRTLGAASAPVGAAALSIGRGPITQVLSAAGVGGVSAQTIGISLGSLTRSLAAAAVAISAATLTVTSGLVKTLGAAATGALSARSLGISQGPVSRTLGAAAVGALSARTLTVSEGTVPQTVNLGAASVPIAARSLSVSVAAITRTLGAASTPVAARTLSIDRGALIRTLGAAAAAVSARALGISTGATSRTLGAASSPLAARTLAIIQAGAPQTITLGAASLPLAAQRLGRSVPLKAAAVPLAAPTLRIQPGALVLTLGDVELAMVARPLTTVGGLTRDISAEVGSLFSAWEAVLLESAWQVASQED